MNGLLCLHLCREVGTTILSSGRYRQQFAFLKAFSSSPGFQTFPLLKCGIYVEKYIREFIKFTTRNLNA